MSKLCKLMVYRHEAQETIIETIEAQDWGDFLIIEMNAELFTEEMFQEVAAGFNNMEKKVILVPKGLDLEFFGVKEEE